MRQDIDLAELGPIRTLTFIENSPPPNHPFDFAAPAPAMAPQTVSAPSYIHDNNYWQMGGPSL